MTEWQTNANNKQEFLQPVQKLTALWALNEAALGGVLYLFKIPFTGLVIGSSSVLLIILIAGFARRSGVIFRSMMLVIIVKGLVSPHTPINAYFAVFLQGILGELLFRFLNYRLAAFLLATLALFFSAMQKFLVITLVFGMNIWHSVDLFGRFIIRQLPFTSSDADQIPLSLLLIIFYMGIHLLAGVYMGIKGPQLFRRLMRERDKTEPSVVQTRQVEITLPPKKHRGFFKRFSGMLVFGFMLLIVALSYLFPVFEKSQGMAAIMMLFRSILIMFIWFKIAAPLTMKALNTFIKRKEHVYAQEVQGIIGTFPDLKFLVQQSWQETNGMPRRQRVNHFLFTLLLRVIS